jgi:hypothetical protein
LQKEKSITVKDSEEINAIYWLILEKNWTIGPGRVLPIARGEFQSILDDLEMDISEFEK